MHFLNILQFKISYKTLNNSKNVFLWMFRRNKAWNTLSDPIAASSARSSGQLYTQSKLFPCANTCRYPRAVFSPGCSEHCELCTGRMERTTAVNGNGRHHFPPVDPHSKRISLFCVYTQHQRVVVQQKTTGIHLLWWPPSIPINFSGGAFGLSILHHAVNIFILKKQGETQILIWRIFN